PPAPARDAYARNAYEAPVGDAETAMAEIWSDILGVARVGRRDNFFELGGHSLLAVRLLERMRQRGMHAEIHVLLASPTLADMAAAVGATPVEVVVPPNLIPDRRPTEPAGGSDTIEVYL
ncbi:MAG TPA: phosphopantetheine-binding protein, partial [Longimicrobiaceae bacterium]|nr:phosphopantetheine-binding protein [Longimicrobiaceae bacterium]